MQAIHIRCKEYASWGFEKIEEACAEIKTKEVATRIFLHAALGAAAFVIYTPFSLSLTLTVEAALVCFIALKLLLGVSKEDIEESLWFSDTMPPNFYTDVIVAPIIEEAIFRGILQPAVRFSVKKISEVYFDEAKSNQIARIASIAVSSILFGATHLTNPMCWEFAILHASFTTIQGIAFGILREESGSIIPGIAHHALWNALESSESFAIFDIPINFAFAFLLNSYGFS